MIKLMKYEFRKTWITKLILLGITAVAECAFLIALYTDHNETVGISAGLLTLLAIGGILVIGLESVVTLHRDMNTRQSYMLFMTPNSSYKILGAKVLECGLSILLAGAFYFALGVLDITLLFSKLGELNKLLDYLNDFLSHFTVNGRAIALDTKTMATLAFQLLSSWILSVSTAYLAVVVSAALLNGKRFNGLLSFVLFLILGWFTSWSARQITSGIVSIMTTLIVYGLIQLVFAAIMYVITAQIMERKLSV